MAEFDTETLASVIREGGGEGYSNVPYSNLDGGDIITFAYKADKPGLANTNLYDAIPLIAVMSVKRSRKDGRILIAGLNTHYLDSKFDRGRVVFSMRSGLRTFGTSLKNRMIHNYLTKNMRSPIYKLSNAVMDPAILKSGANWESVE